MSKDSSDDLLVLAGAIGIGATACSLVAALTVLMYEASFLGPDVRAPEQTDFVIDQLAENACGRAPNGAPRPFVVYRAKGNDEETRPAEFSPNVIYCGGANGWSPARFVDQETEE